MPPRRPPPERAIVNQNHPAATAAAASAAAASAAAAATKINGGILSAPTSRASPSRAAKTLANEQISEICHHNPRAAVAVEAPDDAPATAGVTVDFTAAVADTGVTFLDDPADELPLMAALPPLWNAWWCGACTALHFVGDGGDLIGPCMHANSWP